MKKWLKLQVAHIWDSAFLLHKLWDCWGGCGCTRIFSQERAQPWRCTHWASDVLHRASACHVGSVNSNIMFVQNRACLNCCCKSGTVSAEWPSFEHDTDIIWIEWEHESHRNVEIFSIALMTTSLQYFSWSQASSC